MKAAIYSRYSTDNQREASIEDQRRGCHRIAAAQGLTVVREFDDRGISGGTTQRPGYQSMLSAARAREFDILVVEDLSRLWRARAEYGVRSAELEDLGIHLLTCVGDDTRRDGWGLVLGIKSAISEAQRREISYRTRRGLEGKALNGQPTGGRCFGYGPESAEREADIVRYIFEQAVAGKSANTISRALNATGSTAPAGGPWRPSTVSNILRNPRYRGEVQWGKSEARRSATDSARVARIRRSEPLVTRQDESLRIVSDSLWAAARASVTKRLHRGEDYETMRAS